MEQLFGAVKDWPVIVQGALGSALFSLIIIAGQRATTYLSNHINSVSKNRKRDRLNTQLTRLEALNSSDNAQSAFYAALLWIRASRSVIKALMWLTLGFAFGSFLNVLGVVGFLGCFYYLFKVLEVVKPITDEGDITAKIKDLEQQLTLLDKHV